MQVTLGLIKAPTPTTITAFLDPVLDRKLLQRVSTKNIRRQLTNVFSARYDTPVFVLSASGTLLDGTKVSIGEDA